MTQEDFDMNNALLKDYEDEKEQIFNAYREYEALALAPEENND